MRAAAESLQLAPVRLHSLCEPVQIMPATPLFVRANSKRLDQALLSLLVNAADALEEARGVRRPRLVVEVSEAQQRVRMAVEDNGPGLAPEVLARLFEPFFTTKPKNKAPGSGCPRCASTSSARAAVWSAQNVAPSGARFTIEPPRSEPVDVPRRGDEIASGTRAIDA